MAIFKTNIMRFPKFEDSFIRILKSARHTQWLKLRDNISPTYCGTLVDLQDPTTLL